MKKIDRNTLLLVFIGVLVAIIGILLITFLREKIADWLLPEAMKKYYITYSLEADGVNIPSRMEYLTNNGKLFAFCQSVSSIIVVLLLYLVISKLGLKLYIKCDKKSIQSITKKLELIVLVLAVFTFTSKVNPDANIKKYLNEQSYSSYSQQSSLSDDDRTKIIGYIKLLDLDTKESLIPVYEAPELESAPNIDDDYKGILVTNHIKNISKYNVVSEMTTIILGMYIYVLKGFKERSR